MLYLRQIIASIDAEDAATANSKSASDTRTAGLARTVAVHWQSQHCIRIADSDGSDEPDDADGIFHEPAGDAEPNAQPEPGWWAAVHGHVHIVNMPCRRKSQSPCIEWMPNWRGRAP